MGNTAFYINLLFKKKKKLIRLRKKQPSGKNPNFVHSSFDSVFSVIKSDENIARNN